MEKILNLKREHDFLEGKLKELEQLLRSSMNLEKFMEVYLKFKTMWYKHEKNEEELFKELNISSKDHIKREHASIKGHSKIIDKALETHDRFYIKIVLGTDGELLINRLRNHMQKENQLFDSYAQ